MKFKSKKKTGLSRPKEEVEVDEEEEIQTLLKRVQDEAPERGSQYSGGDQLRFDDMPLSSRTKRGLSEGKLEVAKDIQAAAISHALCGRDILGASKTGSGKTLAFVIPLIEKLYVERWGAGDGLGALIITPTRELAFQIFEVLRVVAKKHQFSAGLITGGKGEFEEEQQRVGTINILVATPGRLLQHLEQTSNFDASQLMMVVLDEADRILDMGFKQQLDAILTYLPSGRQTLLFSATQTKSVKDLARLNLNHPEYLAVHANDEEVTPKQLVQNYIVCKLHEKLDILFSFIKTHTKSKMIIFFSTCSQVRFVYECFRSMQPGLSITALHGKIKQERRTTIYMNFVRKDAACMLATDVAARGLDFPNVDWVLQADAPEDTAMYIHRVGRTARNNSTGRALMLLLPVEESTVAKQVKDEGVPIKKLTVNPNKTVSVATKAAAMLVAQPDLKTLAKKAFSAYLRSIQMLPARQAIDPNTLGTEEFAKSLGMVFTPSVPRVLQAASTGDDEAAKGGEGAREEIRKKKNVNRSLDKLKKQIQEAKEVKRVERLQKKNGGVLSEKDLQKEKERKEKKEKEKERNLMMVDSEEEEEGGELFAVKPPSGKIDISTSSSISSGVDTSSAVLDTKKAKKMKINMDGEVKRSGQVDTPGNKKTTFDDDGNAVKKVNPFAHNRGVDIDDIDKDADIPSGDPLSSNGNQEGLDSRVADHAKRMKSLVDSGRKADLEREKQRIKDKRNAQKEKERKRDKEEEGEEGQVAQLAYTEEGEVSGDDSDDSDDRDGDSEGGSSNNSSDDSVSDSEEETRMGYLSKKRSSRSNQLPSKRRRRDNDSDNDGSDYASDDGEDVDADELKKQERLVSEMLARR